MLHMLYIYGPQWTHCKSRGSIIIFVDIRKEKPSGGGVDESRRLGDIGRARSSFVACDSGHLVPALAPNSDKEMM